MLSWKSALLRNNLLFRAAVAGVLLVAAVLRCHALGDRSLWSDEFLSMECSAGWGRSDLRVAASHAAAPDLLGLDHAKPWTDVWRSVARDENHPPLFFVLLRAWRAAFGDSSTALRSLSVVASLAAVGLIVAAGTEAFGRPAGVWAGLLMAVATPQLREAQDARAYMPATLVGVAVLYLLVRIAKRGATRPTLAALFAALVVLPLLHYMELATVGAVAVYAAVGLTGPARRAVLAVAGAALATCGTCWGATFLAQHDRMLAATAWLTDAADGHVGRTLVSLFTVPVRLVIDPIHELPATTAVGGAVLLIAPLLVAWAYRRRNAATGTAWGGTVGLLWLWMVVPVAVATAIDLTTGRRSLELVKYTLAGAPAVYLLIGAVSATGRRAAWVPAAALACGCLAFLPDVYHPVEPDWRELARAVADQTRPGDPVVVIASNSRDPQAAEMTGMRVVGLEYYLARLAPRDVYVVDGPPTGPVRDALQRAHRAMVVCAGMDASTNNLLAGLSISHAELFVGMGVVGTANRPAAPPPALAQPPVAVGARPIGTKVAFGPDRTHLPAKAAG